MPGALCLQWIDEHRRTAIIVVLLLAALLRLQEINQPYVDYYAWREADTASIADAFASGNWNIFLPQVRWGGPGPNYMGAEFQTVSYIAALGYQAFGSAPWVGRAVSIAFGLWGIFALYQLARRVWDTPRGIAAAAVMAVLPGSVFIERSFLQDGAMTALMTTSLWMLVAYCQTERQQYLIAATLAGTLGILTKITGGILIIPAIYVLTSMYGSKLRERHVQLRMVIVALLVAIPVIAYYLWARHVALGAPPYHFAGDGKFIWHDGLRAWLSKDYFVPKLWRLVDDFWGLPFIALAIVGILLPDREDKGNAPWLFDTWLLAMILRYLIEAKHLVEDPYNLHLFNPLIAAFAGRALVSIADGAIPIRWKGLVASILVFSGGAAFGQVQAHHFFSDSYSRSHYILGQIVAELSHPDDLVISFGQEPIVLYSSRLNGWVFPPIHPEAMIRQLKAEGAQWLVIRLWNSYTTRSASAQQGCCRHC